MANRYWVGGTGNWDASDTSHWSDTSGGSGGFSVPGSGDVVTFDGSSGGGTVTLMYSPTITSITMGAFTGTFDANDYNLTMGTFDCSGTGIRTLNMGSGTWELTSTSTVFSFLTTTNLTLNSETSTIKLTNNSASSKTLVLGTSLTFYNLWISPGTGTGTFLINCTTGVTFNEIKDTGTAAHTLQFQTPRTYNFSSFIVSGSSGNIITIAPSTATLKMTFRKTSGVVVSDFISIQDCTATGGADWYAGDNSTNVSGNTGWVFSQQQTGNFFAFM